jgi:outer membrane cobalamin receptor
MAFEIATLILAVLTLFVLTVTLGVLIWYTFETSKLRRIAEGQQRSSIMPIINLELEQAPRVRNTGYGPAFNVEIQPIKGKEYEVGFNPVGMVTQNSVELVHSEGIQNGQPMGKLTSTGHLAQYLEKLTDDPVNISPEELKRTEDFYAISIAYSDALGNVYRTNLNLRHRMDHQIRVDFKKFWLVSRG